MSDPFVLFGRDGAPVDADRRMEGKSMKNLRMGRTNFLGGTSARPRSTHLVFNALEPSKHGHGEGSQEKGCTNIETDVRRKLSASMMVSGKKPSNSPGGGFSTASEQVPPREKHDHPNWRFDGSSTRSRVSYMSPC